MLGPECPQGRLSFVFLVDGGGIQNPEVEFFESGEARIEGYHPHSGTLGKGSQIGIRPEVPSGPGTHGQRFQMRLDPGWLFKKMHSTASQGLLIFLPGRLGFQDLVAHNFGVAQQPHPAEVCDSAKCGSPQIIPGFDCRLVVRMSLDGQGEPEVNVQKIGYSAQDPPLLPVWR